MTWVDTFFRVTGVCLVFFAPFAIMVITLLVVTIVRKTIPSPLLVTAGFGAMAFTTMLLILLMDPRSQQYSWLILVAIALLVGLLAFLGSLVWYHLQPRRGLIPNLEKWQSCLESRWKEQYAYKRHADAESMECDEEGDSR